MSLFISQVLITSAACRLYTAVRSVLCIRRTQTSHVECLGTEEGRECSRLLPGVRFWVTFASVVLCITRPRMDLRMWNCCLHSLRLCCIYRDRSYLSFVEGLTFRWTTVASSVLVFAPLHDSTLVSLNPFPYCCTSVPCMVLSFICFNFQESLFSLIQWLMTKSTL